MSKTRKTLPLQDASELYPTLISYSLLFPVWTVVVLPITLVSLIVSKASTALKPKPKRKEVVKETNEEILRATKFSKELVANRIYDIVLLGSTGFTGKLAAEYIARQYGTKQFKWAIAGRREDAMKRLRSDLAKISPDLDNLDIIIVDTSDESSVGRMVASTKVVLTTAGPFIKYGSNVVKYCAAYGTHYCDITGETDWVRQMIDKYDDLARQTGAKIVPHCGHDCVPWDLIVMECSSQLKRLGDTISKISIFDELRGEASGGTMDTALHILTSDRSAFKPALGYDPLLKAADGSKSSNVYKVKNAKQLKFGKEHKKWVGPFIMAAVMANCVRRSNVLLNYSSDLTYSEGLVYPSFLAAFTSLIHTIYFGSAMICVPLRELLFKVGYLPKPGEGPSKESMDAGFLRVIAYATGVQGKKCKAQFYFPTDPGYRDTARIMVESGLCFIFNMNDVAPGGGILTPASCQGQVLIQRLVQTGSSIQVDISE